MGILYEYYLVSVCNNIIWGNFFTQLYVVGTYEYTGVFRRWDRTIISSVLPQVPSLLYSSTLFTVEVLNTCSTLGMCCIRVELIAMWWHFEPVITKEKQQSKQLPSSAICLLLSGQDRSHHIMTLKWHTIACCTYFVATAENVRNGDKTRRDGASKQPSCLGSNLPHVVWVGLHSIFKHYE